MSNSRLKHLKPEKGKFKSVNEIIFFFNWKNLSYFEEKGGRLVPTFSQIWTSNSHNFSNLQQILDYNINLKFKIQSLS